MNDRTPIRVLRMLAGRARGAGRALVREPRAVWLMVRMAGWIALLSFLMRVMPLPRALAFVTTAPRRRRSSTSRVDSAIEEARLAQLLDRLLDLDWFCFTPTCWKRAPILHRYLALRGIETRIMFGVRREQGGVLDGHAWLEAGGKPLLEKHPPNYTVTYSFPA